MKPIIVGVDPGTYVGIAVFDVNARLLSAVTITNGGKEAAVAEIARHGTPIVVASDVSPPPELVTQIASYFNARLACPRRSLLEKDKTEAAAPFKPGSAHERDAIAAVVDFFKENANKMRWVERVLRDKGLSCIEPDVKRFVLSGVRVDDAIRALVPSQKEYGAVLTYAATLPDKPKRPEKPGDRHGTERELLAELLEANAKLRSRISVLIAEKQELERKMVELLSGDVRRLEREHERERSHYRRKIEKLRLLLNRQREAKAKLKNLGEKTKPAADEGGGKAAKTVGTKSRPGIDISDLEGILDEYRNERENGNEDE